METKEEEMAASVREVHDAVNRVVSNTPGQMAESAEALQAIRQFCAGKTITVPAERRRIPRRA
eukprot:11189357-Lingulodinium_polyedra.AAC.1